MHVHAQVCTPICWGSQWTCAVNSTLLHRSSALFTYLLAAMAAMTGPLTHRRPPPLLNVPPSGCVKILRAPSLVWQSWLQSACTRVVGCIQGNNCFNAFTLLVHECVCVSQSKVSLNNLAAGFVALAIHPFTALYVSPLGIWTPCLCFSGSDWMCRDRWQTLACRGARRQESLTQDSI